MADAAGELYIVMRARRAIVGAQPFRPGVRPEMSHEVSVSFDLSSGAEGGMGRHGPLYFTELRYDGDWENVAKYQSIMVTPRTSAVPRTDAETPATIPHICAVTALDDLAI